MLDAQKIDLTAANIRGVAEALDGLRIAGAVSDKDLAGFVGEVAKSGAVFQRAGLDVKEQFAVSAALKDRGVEGAGAGLESMIGKLSKAGDDKAAQEALATIGLTTEDVTLSKDQDLIQVMAKLDKALSTQAAPGDRGAILADIVGKQGFGVGETLMEEIRAGTVGKLMDAQRGEYSASAERAMSSEATVLQRLQTQADVAKAEKGQGAEVIRKALETVLAEQGVIGPQAQLALKAFDTGTGFASPEQAIQSAALTLPQNLFNQGESLKKRVIDKARAARRPDTLGQVGDSDLTSDVSSAVSEYSGPSLSERKAQEEQGDAELDRLKLELEDLELQKEKQESAGKPQSKLHGGSELDKRIKAKKLQISEQDNRIKHSKLEGRAAGGPVAAGEPYIVGEKGPELFLPGQGGEILSNPNLTDLLARSAQFKQQQDAMRAASKEWAAGWLDRHIERMGSDREYAAGIRQGIHDDKVAANRAKLGIDHEGAERRFKASMVNMSRHSSAGGRRPAAARGPKGKPGDAAAPGGQFGPTASQSAGSGSYTHANLEGGGAMAAQMADLLNVNRQILLVLRNMQQRGIQRNAQMS
jgi:hypothetical protein